MRGSASLRWFPPPLWVRVGGGKQPNPPTPLPHPPLHGERGQIRRVGWLLLLLGAFSPAPLHAQPVTAKATADRPTIRLSETVRVTLTVEGPAPLRVEVPDPPLAKEAAAAWYVRPAGPAAVAPLPGGRERWSRTYRLDPFPGGPPVAFAPLTVTAGTANRPDEVTAEPVAVAVTTTLAGAKPDDARTVTGIEELAVPPPPASDRGVWLVGAGPALLLAAAVLVGLRRRWRARNRVPPPGAWAAAEFDRLGGGSGEAFADRLAAVLRGYVERRYGVPAPRLTTAELAAEAGRAGWPADGLRELLGRCDRAKFAGEAPDAAEAAALLVRAREWVSGLGERGA